MYLVGLGWCRGSLLKTIDEIEPNSTSLRTKLFAGMIMPHFGAPIKINLEGLI